MRSQSTEAFRRNTVVVSRSQREVAEHKQSVTQRQIDAKKRSARRRTRRRLAVAVILLLSIAFVVRMRVSGVVVQPQDPSVTIDTAEETTYTQAAINYVNTQVPLGQSWLINTDQLQKSLQTKHPEIKSAHIHTSNPLHTTVRVRLDFRKPIFIWKGVDGSTRYIDAQGVLFSQTYYPGLTKTLPTVEDQGASSSSTGAVIATAGLTQTISQIYKQLPPLYTTQKTAVTKVVLPRSARELQAYIHGVPYYIKFSTDRPVATQIGELQQLVAYLGQNNVTPSTYIDLRVAHKAYYK